VSALCTENNIERKRDIERDNIKCHEMTSLLALVPRKSWYTESHASREIVPHELRRSSSGRFPLLRAASRLARDFGESLAAAEKDHRRKFTYLNDLFAYEKSGACVVSGIQRTMELLFAHSASRARAKASPAHVRGRTLHTLGHTLRV